MKLREFTKNDWYAFAGAEKPEKGEPLIGVTENIIVVVDNLGVEVILVGDPYNVCDYMETTYVLDLAFPAAKLLVENMNNFSPETLKKFGFNKVSE